MRRNGCGMSAGGPQGRQPQAHCRIDRRRGASLVSCFLFFTGSGARSGRNAKEAFPTETWRRRGGPRSSGSTDSLTGAVCSDATWRRGSVKRLLVRRFLKGEQSFFIIGRRRESARAGRHLAGPRHAPSRFFSVDRFSKATGNRQEERGCPGRTRCAIWRGEQKRGRERDLQREVDGLQRQISCAQAAGRVQ